MSRYYQRDHWSPPANLQESACLAHVGIVQDFPKLSGDELLLRSVPGAQEFSSGFLCLLKHLSAKSQDSELTQHSCKVNAGSGNCLPPSFPASP